MRAYTLAPGATGRYFKHYGEKGLERRAALWADKAWPAYVTEVGGLLVGQENQILTPASFFKVPDPA